MSFTYALFGRLPGLEVASRRIYARTRNVDIVKKSKLLKWAKNTLTGRSSKSCEIKSWKNYKEYIRNLGIHNGDILIVHSSMDGLKKMNVQKEEIISFLREMVGPEGTLVMPAYPFYRTKDIELKFDEETEETRVYKLRASSWTGILPNYLCTLEGAKRSLFPLDTLAAIGKEADAMMENNLKGQTSHGKYTAWDYCNNHHAKILFMGIVPSHCNSGLHLFEDLNEEEWPIKGWYKEQKFVIKNGNEEIEFTCKMRKRFWNQYLTENHWMMKLIRHGILKFEHVEDTPIGYVNDLNKMTCFMADSVKRERDLLSWRIPAKYWK